MKFTLFIIALLVTVSSHAQTAPAGSARDYFNLGSATFIKENPEQALAVVNEGLAIYPQDEPLLKLKALLEQQNEQEQQQNEDQQNNDQEENENPQDQPDENDQEQDEEQDEPEDENPDEQNEDESDQKNEDEPSEEQQASPEDMSEEEANMVLDSLRQLEQAQREQLTRQMIEQQMNNMPPVEKDW